jgi:hypothetical protein
MSTLTMGVCLYQLSTIEDGLLNVGNSLITQSPRFGDRMNPTSIPLGLETRCVARTRLQYVNVQKFASNVLNKNARKSSPKRKVTYTSRMSSAKPSLLPCFFSSDNIAYHQRMTARE